MKEKSFSKGVVMKKSTKRSKCSKVVLVAAALAFTAIMGGCGEKKDPIPSHQETVELMKTSVLTTDGITWRDEYEYDDHGDLRKGKHYKYEGDIFSIAEIEEYEYDDMGRVVKYRSGKAQEENGDVNWEDQYKAVYDGKGNIKKEYYKYNGYSLRIVHEYDTHAIRRKIKSYEKYKDDKKEYLSACEKYDDQGNLIRSEKFHSNGTSQSLWEYKYNDLGNMTFQSFDDESVRVNEYEYDDQGNEIRYTHYNYDGTPESKTENEYDDHGNKTRTVEYDENETVTSVTESEYDDCGNTIKTVEYDGNGTITSVTESKYDDHGNTIKTVKYDEDGVITYKTESEYDDQDNEIKSVEYDKDGIVTNFHLEYDSQGRPWKEITYNADGNIIRLMEYAYDEKGYQTHSHFLRYDENGKIISEITYDYEMEELTVTIPDKCDSEYQRKYTLSGLFMLRPKKYEPASGTKIQ